MDSIDKIELIVKGTLERKKRERKNGNEAKHSKLYLRGLDYEIDMLEFILGDIYSIKRNTDSVSDEMLVKMYGPIENRT
jgi:hypothetical protein